MLVVKTLTFRVHRATGHKTERLRWLWRHWGRTGYKMHDNMTKRYPTKKVFNQWRTLQPQENFDSRIARWWFRVPITKGEWINLPVRSAPQHEGILNVSKVVNSEFIRKGNSFYFHVTIKREVSPPLMPGFRVLAVDIGERNPATSVMWNGERKNDPKFYARRMRGVRRHYAWLRRTLQERGHFRTMGRVGNSEARRIEDLLHKTARVIVNKATRENALIAIGDLTGLGRRIVRGKRLRRIVHAIPNFRLVALILHKAAWAGVPVLLV